jgi:hypothetical protein
LKRFSTFNGFGEAGIPATRIRDATNGSSIAGSVTLTGFRPGAPGLFPFPDRTTRFTAGKKSESTGLSPANSVAMTRNLRVHSDRWKKTPFARRTSASATTPNPVFS